MSADHPAFPQNEHSDRFIDQGSGGMSLRDWFAGQMLPRIGMGWPNEENRELIARQSYEMADAMLKERDKQS